MYRSIVMHQLDYNKIAACEEWYYRYHGPQLARRYGPWLERFESYRPVPLPDDLSAERIGYTNWLVTAGMWREIPKEGPQGEMSLTSPREDCRNFGIFLPPQSGDDFKGSGYSPEEKACLRFVFMIEYPEGTEKQSADEWFLNTMAKEISDVDEAYRFISAKALTEEIHLPGTWKPDDMAHMQEIGDPADHRWDRYAEIWFETFDEVRAFFEKSKGFTHPAWAQTDEFPFLIPYSHFVSTFLLERPAYNWLENFNVYR